MSETDGVISASPEGGVGRAKPQIFISYGREDGLTFTERLVHDLATDYDAVYDNPRLLAGSAWIPQLDEAIFSSQAVIAVLTPSAVRYAKDLPEKGDSFCHNETRAALNAKIPVLLVRPQDCKIPTHLNTQHCIDFKHLGYSAALAQLRRSIGALITDGSAPTAPTQGIRDEWSLAPSFQWVLDKHKTFYGRHSLFGEIDAWRCRSDAGRMLLITGLAGAGKSSIAVQLVNEQCCGHVLAYHFCRYEDLNTLRPINFIRNLVVTLAQEFPAYRELLAEPRAQAELARLSDDDDKDRPESLLESVILEPMQTIVPPQEFADKPALIIIDALDEAVRFARDGGTNSIVDLIVEELPRLPSWLRVVATCRPGTDTAHRLGMLSENGHALVENLPLGTRSNDADLDVCIEQQFAAVGKSAPSDEVRSLIRTSSNGNFQFLTLLLHRLIKDAGTEDEMIAMIRRTPPGLNAWYHVEFVRLYGAFASEPSWDLARRLLGMLVVAREPLSMGLLTQALDIGDKDLGRELRRLDGYLEEQNGSYLIGHKSVSDWLLDAHDAMDFALDEPGCHAIAADLCWKAFEGVRKRTVKANFVRLADDEVSRYVVLHGVVHCLLAGRIARAVALIHFIVRHFDESRVEGTRFVLLSPARLTRLLMREIDDCSDAEKRAINPTQLAYLIKNFYQVEPLSAPLRILIGYHANEWFDIRKELLSADNYVVRFSTSEALADSLISKQSPRAGSRGSMRIWPATTSMSASSVPTRCAISMRGTRIWSGSKILSCWPTAKPIRLDPRWATSCST